MPNRFDLDHEDVQQVYDDGFSTGFVVGIFSGFAIALLGFWVW